MIYFGFAYSLGLALRSVRPSRIRSGCWVRGVTEKAYDIVHWQFLFHIMNQYDFHHKFIEWIKACIYNPEFSLIINGSPME